jgi:hypothetical protein
MICGITLLLVAREITVGVYNNFNENQNTVNHIFFSIACTVIYTGVNVWEKSHTYKKPIQFNF